MKELTGTVQGTSQRINNSKECPGPPQLLLLQGLSSMAPFIHPFPVTFVTLNKAPVNPVPGADFRADLPMPDAQG